MHHHILRDLKICIRGGGDLASGIAYRLFKAGFQILILELKLPTMIRRSVSYGNAVYENEVVIENVKAKLIKNPLEIYKCWDDKIIPVMIDEEGKIINYIKAQIVIDARMLRRNISNNLKKNYALIGIGPGFEVGKNCNYAIETSRGHYLGRVIYSGSTQAPDGKPYPILGYSDERVIRAPEDGHFQNLKSIGDFVNKNDVIGKINNEFIHSKINGIIRGLIHPNVYVRRNQKIADIDPRGVKEYAFKISDKSLAIGGGVLEAVLNYCKSHIA